MRKIYCDEVTCRYYDETKCTSDKLMISRRGKCTSYKPTILIYYRSVVEVLGDKNFITGIELTDEVKLGLYIMMTVYNCKFASDDIRGMITIGTEDGAHELLDYEGIISLPADMDKYMQLSDRFDELYDQGLSLKEIMQQFQSDATGKSVDEINAEKASYVDQEYGWLSPTGVFTKSPWGTHEESAEEIISKKHFVDEYHDWHLNHDNSGLCRDFLCEVKGYALIHDPSQLSYHVTHIKPLTKHQNEFLFDYFTAMDMNSVANNYVTD